MTDEARRIPSCVRAAREERRGPVFTRAPPERVEFLNSSQAVVPCEAQGVPRPEVWWWRVGSDGPAPDIPGLRHVRTHDGALVFSPFRAEDFRQDIHAAVYRCGARNSVGSVVSGDVHVRAEPAPTREVPDCPPPSRRASQGPGLARTSPVWLPATERRFVHSALNPCCCYVVSTPDIYPTTITSSQGLNQPTASWSPSTAT
ncbi:hypothetical protein HPB51_004151 [Rhipicephalus microplus]|uniref:Ig-like domain-containing protein n=1 Tax=Rhipicephalus microplus TaxID=6941 RepID=A0A9J6DT34_RHIMP|nr:hypothetical protein HPB51_004151 [Rhipicephalus microplus]